MIRLLLERLLLFMVPFALYAIYLRLRTKDESTPTQPHPWTVLFISGLVLVAVSFLYLGATGGTGQRGIYVPPRVEDGRVVPGRVEPGRGK
jgi:heme/copper-type cytochrome/quinol oxidase subunit 3